MTARLDPIEGDPPMGVETAPAYKLIQTFAVGRGQLSEAVGAGKVRAWKLGRRTSYSVEDVAAFFPPRHADGRGFVGSVRASGGGQDEDDDDDEADDCDESPRRRGKLPSLADYGLSSLVRELVLILRETRQEKSELHQLALQPMATGVQLLTEMLKERTARVSELEAGWLDMLLQREELVSLKADRDLRQKAAEAAERRRDQAVRVLGDQVPAVISGWVKQSELKGFLQSMPAEIVDVLREHGSAEIRKKLDALMPKVNGSPSAHPPAGGDA